MVLSLNSTHHRKFYKDDPFFHVGCRPSLHVGLHLLQHLYLTMGGTHPTTMSERLAQHSHLTMGGTHPTTMSKRPSTHIRPWEEHIQEPYRKGSALISEHGRNTSKNHVRKAQHLYLTMGGTHPRTMLERINTYI